MNRKIIISIIPLVINLCTTPVFANKYLCFGVSVDFKKFLENRHIEKEVNSNTELVSLMNKYGYSGFKIMFLDNNATLIAKVRLKQVEIFTSGPLCLNAIEPIHVTVPLKFVYLNRATQGEYSGAIIYHVSRFPRTGYLYKALKSGELNIYANTPTSSSGFLLQQIMLKEKDISIDPNDHNVFFSGSHINVIKSVINDPQSAGFCGSFILDELHNPDIAHISTDTIPTNGLYFTHSLSEKKELYSALLKFFSSYRWSDKKQWYLSIEEIDSTEYLNNVKRFNITDDNGMSLWISLLAFFAAGAGILIGWFYARHRRVKYENNNTGEYLTADYNRQDFHEELIKLKEIIPHGLYRYLSDTYRFHTEDTLDISAIMAGKSIEKMLKDLHDQYVKDSVRIKNEDKMIHTLMADLKKQQSLDIRSVDKMINQVQEMRNTACHDNSPIDKKKANVLFSCMVHILDWYVEKYNKGSSKNY